MPVPHDRRPAISRRLQKHEVQEKIRAAVVRGDLAPGSRLRDAELEAWLGVSRTPIRTALVRLETVGLVESVPQRGTRVARPRPSVVPDLVAALCALWRDLPREGRGLLRPGSAREVRGLLDRCSASIETFRSAPRPGVDESRAVVDALFACVAHLEGDDVPAVTRAVLDDLGARLRHQAALLGRRLDTGSLTVCLAEVDTAVSAGDPRALQGALDGLARRTAVVRRAPQSPRPPWWRR